MKALLYDILASLRRWGVTHVFNLNWHGDVAHNLAILDAVREAREETGIRAYCILNALDVKRFGLSGREPHVIVRKSDRHKGSLPKYLEIHAESTETGIMARYFPSQVDVNLAGNLKSTDLTFDDLMVWRQGWDDARKVTPQGYFGDPAGFDPDRAEELISGLGRETADLIELFLKGDYRPEAVDNR